MQPPFLAPSASGICPAVALLSCPLSKPPKCDGAQRTGVSGKHRGHHVHPRKLVAGRIACMLDLAIEGLAVLLLRPLMSLLLHISGRRRPPAAPLKPPGLHLRPVCTPPGTAGSLGSGSRFCVLPWQGLIKIRGDQCWRDLTCMDFHYEVSCMAAADPAPCPCLPGPGAPALIPQAQASRRPQLSSWRPLLFALLAGHRQVTRALVGRPVCWAGGGLLAPTAVVQGSILAVGTGPSTAACGPAQVPPAPGIGAARHASDRSA